MLANIGVLLIMAVLLVVGYFAAIGLLIWRRSSFPTVTRPAGGVPIAIWLELGLAALAATLLAPTFFFEHEPGGYTLISNLPWVQYFLTQFLPTLAPIMAALLISAGLRHWSGPGGTTVPVRDGRTARKAASLAALALGLLVFLGGLYQLYWLMVWDSTYDSLGSILLGTPLLAALFGAALLALLQPGSRKLTALLFALIVPAAMIAVSIQAKSVDFRALTGARAARITQALETYHARHGAYPDSLGKLVPGELLSIPGPVIMHGQHWCYQGEPDAYRLGFVDRQHWSSPNLFATLASSAGKMKSDGDLCQDAIALMQASYPDYYGRGN